MEDITKQKPLPYLGYVRAENSQAGLTLSEILIALVILSVGLVFLSAVIPVALSQSDKANQSSISQAIAMNYFALIKTLPYDFTNEDLQTRLTDYLDNANLEENEKPIISETSTNNSTFTFPPDDTDTFFDRTVSNGEYVVSIKYFASDSGVQGRVYTISVRKTGGDWKVFTFIKAKTNG